MKKFTVYFSGLFVLGFGLLSGCNSGSDEAREDCPDVVSNNHASHDASPCPEVVPCPPPAVSAVPVDVPLDAFDIRPILPGQTLPQISVKTGDNEPLNLNDSIAQKETIIVVFRGGWCPYCNIQLGQLKEIQKELAGLGFQIVGISTDKPTTLKAHAAENNFSYTVVSDAEMTAAKALGIAFKVDDETYNKYKSKFKIDLEEFSGFDHHLLPVPSVFIVDKEGVVQFSYVNPDYKTRLSANVLLAAAKAMKE